MQARTVFKNGSIHTMNDHVPVAEALAVDETGRILALGNGDEIADQIAPDTRIVDLGGKFAMPGIIDFHLHVLSGMTTRLRSVPIDSGDDFETILASVRTAAATKDKDAWITGSAYGGPALAEIEALGLNAKHLLDDASGGRPVLLTHASLHGGFASASALSQAGVDRDTPDPPSGRFLRVAGEATGLLEENAMWSVASAIPALREDEMADVARQAISYFNSLGLTGFCDAMSTPEMLVAFRELDLSGALSCWAGFHMSASKTCPAWSPEAEASVARRAEICGPHMIAEGVKIFLDGVPSLRTAAFLDPYPGTEDERGEMSLTLDELTEQIAHFDSQGVSVKVHAIGDHAVRRTLDAVERVRRKNSPDGPWHHIAHGQFIRPEDIQRLKRLKVIWDINPPLWFVNRTSVAHERIVGAARYAGAWPIGTALESGANMAVGSDWMTIFPELDPWQALAGLLTRRDPSGLLDGAHAPDEAITLDQALRLMTRNCAENMRLGDKTGQLAPGRSCDMIVLDRNLYDIPPAQIAAVRVLKTYFEGREVFAADRG